MTDLHRQFHETWLGMVQPSEGLVVSVPVLVEAQCMEKQAPEVQRGLLALTAGTESPAIRDLRAFFTNVLGLSAERFHTGAALPEALSHYVPEGTQRLAPTMALLAASPRPAVSAEAGPEAKAGRAYTMLVWQLPEGLALAEPETQTGTWEYPPAQKFERLLRTCRVPIGLLCNGCELRLFYAPHGESTGWLTFRVADMASAGGRPILDAFVMLLSSTRFFGVAPELQLPELLRKSRLRQSDVTSELARQVFEALEILLAGFSAAAERDGDSLLRTALEQRTGGLPDSGSQLYGGLLTLLLRLVFVLYCEERGLLPVESALYAKNLSLLGLYEELLRDRDAFPDSMSRRFGAYPRLLALFRAIYFGAHWQEGSEAPVSMPPRRGQLFDPNAYPFLEGWGPEGSAPIEPKSRAALRVPAVDDLTLCNVLEKLLVLDGQRLSYKALDVEQIGSVYEALMGFDVERLEAPAVRIKLGSKPRAARVWVQPSLLMQLPKAERLRHLQDALGFDKNVATKITEAVNGAGARHERALSENKALLALEPLSGRRPETAPAAALVVQPGPERRRTSSHYTPRALTEPIVERSLAPLFAAMGEAPKSESLLNLVICDPAMGSGAFLVAACRALADQLVAAWTREGKLAAVTAEHGDPVNHGRRLIAQRCLYGVDKNAYAVQLGRLSLWLVTMAKNEPFTFVDHALRHGDSLLGLSFAQIRAFHWQPGKQVQTCERVIQEALDEAVGIRKRIQELASDGSEASQREKERSLFDAEDAVGRVRLLGDLVIGAFFSADSPKARAQERDRRLALVERWLGGEEALEPELRALQAELRERQVPFHFMAEFPEVFYLERPDPLDGDQVSGHAYVEAFVGNPPFAGKNGITEQGGPGYLEWLQALHEGAHGNSDLCAHFFRRAASLTGDHGTISLIATNTIGQGDTRATGLQQLVNHGFTIYAAEASFAWPGDAAVTVSVVQLAAGNCARAQVKKGAVFDGGPAQAINSRLRPKPERPDPRPLHANAELSFQGSIVLGMGFTLTPAERDALTAKNKQNAERIFPYLGGEEVNTSPTQSFERYVINFGQMSLQEAERWPDLLAIVREKVKPERDGNNRENYRDRWWMFGEYRPGLYAAIAPLGRCLVTARVSKHLMLHFQPTNRVFSEQLYVYPLDHFTAFAALQSRVHEPWARLLSSSMKTDLRYAASDCFETFPFPAPEPRAVHPALESIGQKLYDARAAFMTARDVGLTKTYNALKDRARDEPAILALRALHEAMDSAVLAAYGWQDLAPPPYCPTTPEHEAQKQAFDDEVLDRLFALNEARARDEERKGAGAAKPKKAGKSKVTKPKAPSDDQSGFGY